MPPPAFPISHVVRRDQVPDTGIDISIEADAAERTALAEFFKIPCVESLAANLHISAWHRQGLAVRGSLTADVIQTCVVSLEPVSNTVSEEIAAYYLPEGAAAGHGPVEEAIDAEGEDIEVLTGESVDIGALVVEHLALGLDPYPRKPGIVFEAQASPPESEESPFAKLAELKKRKADR